MGPTLFAVSLLAFATPAPDMIAEPVAFELPARALWATGDLRFEPLVFDYANGDATSGARWRLADQHVQPRKCLGGFQSLAYQPLWLNEDAGYHHMSVTSVATGLVLRSWQPETFRLGAFPNVEWRTDRTTEIGVRISRMSSLIVGVFALHAEFAVAVGRRATPVALAGASPTEMAVVADGARVLFPASITRIGLDIGVWFAVFRVEWGFATNGTRLTTAAFAIPFGPAVLRSH
jgi:hypothetical protein